MNPKGTIDKWSHILNQQTKNEEDIDIIEQTKKLIIDAEYSL